MAKTNLPQMDKQQAMSEVGSRGQQLRDFTTFLANCPVPKHATPKQAKEFKAHQARVNAKKQHAGT